jgi:hypothetical protein
MGNILNTRPQNKKIIFTTYKEVLNSDTFELLKDKNIHNEKIHHYNLL